MEPTWIALAALAVLAALVWFALRRSNKALPPPPTVPAEVLEGEHADGTEPTTAPSSEAPESPGPPEVAAESDRDALRRGLRTTRGGFVQRLARLFGQKSSPDREMLEEVEEVLLGADIGVHTSQRILERLSEHLQGNPNADGERIWATLRSEAEAILAAPDSPLRLVEKPSVVVVVGVNGVGKTTTIGKIAAKWNGEGKKVLLAAGDTFRAAAVLQLEVWGRRVGIPVVSGAENADPASVIFDAIKKAQTESFDVVIADTAGRLHTKAPLMEELKKVMRTVEKALGRPADEVLLVLDSTNGQNAIQQAQLFRDAVDVSGVALTKLDGTAKGGVILGIVDRHRIPVRFVGVGEKVEDLRDFDPKTFAEALFEPPEGPASAP
ncbi:MAG: signal recognition particle-docking protein FtsY [Myxococcales bacterium]|nr:signal recognition particle-docking protein FtsY [Myxococcales bacterium]